MVTIIPYKRVVIVSALPLDQAIARLSGEVADLPRGLRLWPANVGRFEGKISSDGFQISRGIRYRNSFKPILYGKFHTLNGGTQIDVTLRPHSIVVAAMLIWCSPCCSLWIVNSLAGKFPPLAFFCFLFLLYLFVLSSFNAELGNSLKLLQKIYEA
jgi:hypothetical protein